jgi:hypothetical protein
VLVIILLLVHIVLLIPCIYGNEESTQNSDSTSTVTVSNYSDQEDDFLLAQLREVMQEDEHDTTQDRLDLLISDMASEKSNEEHRSFLYAYVAPYYCSLLLLYSRIKLYVTNILSSFSAESD